LKRCNLSSFSAVDSSLLLSGYNYWSGRNWPILLGDSTDRKWLIAQDDLGNNNWHTVQGTSNVSILLHRAFQITASGILHRVLQVIGSGVVHRSFQITVCGILYRVLQVIVSSLLHRAFQNSQWHIVQDASNDRILLPGYFRYRAYIVMREHIQFLQHFVLQSHENSMLVR
jgi:hypothetical protein